MAQNTSTRHKHNLASLDPKPSMDPTEKTKHTIYHPSTSNPHPHPHPPNPTIQYISNNFSKLYTNHKMLSSPKPTEKVIHSHPHQPPSNNTTLLRKPVPMLSKLDSSCTTLTKSKSQHGTRFSTKTNVVKEKILVKLTNFEQLQMKVAKPVEKYPKGGEYEITHKEWKTKESIQENGKNQDVKKAHSLMSRSYNSIEGCCDVKKAESLKSLSYNEEFCDVKKAQSLMGRSYNEDSCDVKRPSFSVGGNGGRGRRKSFCSSQTEMADFFLCNSVKVVAVDMPPFMQIHAVDCARKAHDSLEKFTARSLASTLKREFDGVYGPAWHCIVGTSFGSFVTHSVGGFMYFSMDQKLYILLFKTTVQKAE